MKFIGLTIVFLSCASLGAAVCRVKKQQIEYIEALISLISAISSKIRCFRTELSDIYSEYNNSFLEKCGFCTVLRTDGFKAAIIRIGNKFPIPEYENTALSDFADRLGKTDGEDQLSNCSSVLETLNNYRDAISFC